MADDEDFDPWTSADKIQESSDRDVIFYAGRIDFTSERKLLKEVRRRKKSTDVLLLLTTLGGDADAAHPPLATTGTARRRDAKSGNAISISAGDLRVVNSSDNCFSRAEFKR